MQNYITFMFWFSCLSVFFKAFHLTKKHPRTQTQTFNIGEDTLILIIAIALLAWVSVLKFG